VGTSGDGGRKIRESVRIKTNDPNRPYMEVAVTGMVEKFVEIKPAHIRFMGSAGKPLFMDVEIIPRKEYPFKIKRLEASDGAFIKYKFKEKCAEGKGRCVIRVENTKADKGSYVDSILIHTDSSLRPIIPIRISGRIL